MKTRLSTKHFFSFFCTALFASGVLLSHPAAADAAGARSFAAPETVSAEMAKTVAAPPPALWLTAPESDAALSKMAANFAKAGAATAEAIVQQYGISVEETTLAGVPVRILSPKAADPAKKGKVILYIHGGGYVFGHGIAGITEGALLTGLEGWTVAAVDYRMAPEHRYPAAIDDAFAVYKELLKDHRPQDIAVFGTSTGGAMTLVLSLQAHAAGVPQPGALISGTPWADIRKVGDTYFTNDGVDNVLGTYDKMLRTAAKAYVGSADPADPLISPVLAADEALAAFPPTLLVSGTRDLFLSNTVRMHKRLLMNDVHAELIVHEALSHAQYYLNTKAPETAEHYQLLDDFLERTLLKN